MELDDRDRFKLLGCPREGCDGPPGWVLYGVNKENPDAKPQGYGVDCFECSYETPRYLTAAEAAADWNGDRAINTEDDPDYANPSLRSGYGPEEEWGDQFAEGDAG